MNFKPGSGYLIYRARDIGYGVERGDGQYVYTGETDSVGKHTFEGIEEGQEAVYLFEDEVEEWVILD